MAKHKKEDNDEKSEVVLTPEQQVNIYLKDNKENHYNFEQDCSYKVKSSSLLLNLSLNGGIIPGVSRFTGITTGGKTSCSLDFMFNFLKEKNKRRGVFFKAEGRLGDGMKERSGINFVNDVNLWTDGTCLIIDTNIYEAVFTLIRNLIIDNSTNTKYFFIVDSMDMMLRKEDVARPLEEAHLVAGGALITSTFLKKVNLALNKRGHIAIFISQVRDEIKINPYQSTLPRQGRASGGHAIEHAPNTVLDFRPRTNEEIIREKPNDNNSKIIGHWCKVKILKDDSEKALTEVKYPIKYWRTGGKSVWIELEIIDLMLAFEILKKGGAWFTIQEELITEIKNDLKLDFPAKFQGINNIKQYLEENFNVTEYLYNKFTNTLGKN